MSDQKSPAEPTATEQPPPALNHWVNDAQDATNEEQNLGLLDVLRLSPKAVFWSVIVSTAIIMEGYDTMLVGNLIAQPAFQQRYGIQAEDETYEISAAWQAGLANGSVCGQLMGLLLSGYVSERFGFRKTLITGLLVIIGCIFIPFFAPNLPVLLTGQILFGIPLGLFQTIPVVYAMEVAPAALRPYLTTYVNMGWAIGHLIGAGILRGSLSLPGELAYRVPFAIQWIWPVIMLPPLLFAPESPWWLVRQGRLSEAKKMLKRVIPENNQTLDLDKQIALMVVTTEHERSVKAQTSYLALFKGADLRRTLITMGVYCTQTLSGNPLRGYSTYFLTKAGLPSTQAFNMTIVGYALALAGGLFTWVLLPIVGRRTIFVYGLVMMFGLMILIGSLGIPQAQSSDVAYSWAIGSILIVSSFLYNCTMGAITNTVCAEVPSALLRSKTVVIARWSYTALNIAAGTLTPYQLNTTEWAWGAKTGFFWAGGCLICTIFGWFCLPETKGRATAEIDILFERKVAPRKFSKTAVDLVEAIEEQEKTA